MPGRLAVPVRQLLGCCILPDMPTTRGTLHSCLLEDGQRLAVLADVQQLESELARSGAPGG